VLAGQAQADLVEVSSATVTAIVMESQDNGAIVDGVPRLAAFPRTLPAEAIAQ